jgi:hypothetical protein
VNAAPETLAQTRERDRTKTRYLRAGLCDPCAAQAAWAHQNHGDTWQTIHPPCVACAPIVDLLPIADAQPLVAEVLQEAGVAVSLTKGILDGSHPQFTVHTADRTGALLVRVVLRTTPGRPSAPDFH